MRHASGWIKVYRSAIEGDIGQSAVCFLLFSKLVAWATLKPTTVRFNGSPRLIPRGSVVTGIRELADALGCARETTYRHLKYLESRDTIRREVGTEGTLITIVNFDRYQGDGSDAGHERDADGTPTERGLGHGVVTDPNPNEEVQEEKKERRESQRAHALPRLAEIWNLNCKTLARVKGCSSSRRKAADLRWKEMPDEKHWTDVVTRIANSPFCSGKNERGWKATFDFLVRPDTQHRALEGQYDAKRTGINTTPVRPEDL